MLRTTEKTVPDRNRLSKRLREVETTLANLADVAGKGGAVPAVLDALNRAEAERRALVAELKTPDEHSGVSASDLEPRALRRTLRGYLEDWQGLIRGNVAEARSFFDLVLRDRIRFRPVERRSGPSYELTLPMAFDRLLVKVVPSLQVRVASPTGTGEGCKAKLLGIAA